MRRFRGLLLALLGIAIAVFGFFIIQSQLNRATTARPVPTLPPPPTVEVLVTTRAVPIRAILRAQDLKLLKVPVDLAPTGGLTSIEVAVGRITKISLAPGEMVLQHHLADPTNVNKDLAFAIADDQVLMAFPADDLMSQINLLQPGDLVDILVSLEVPVVPGEGTETLAPGEEVVKVPEMFTFNALQRTTLQAVVVEIVQQRAAARSSTPLTGSAARPAVGGPTPTPVPTPTPAPSQIQTRAIILALSPQDALVLKHVKDTAGVIDIVLRSPTSGQLFEADPVMPDYIRDLFELSLPR